MSDFWTADKRLKINSDVIFQGDMTTLLVNMSIYTSSRGGVALAKVSPGSKSAFCCEAMHVSMTDPNTVKAQNLLLYCFSVPLSFFSGKRPKHI